MNRLREFFDRLRKKMSENRQRRLVRESEGIFTVGENDGQMWYFCNDIGMFPCADIGKKKDDDIIEFLKHMRKLYVETE